MSGVIEKKQPIITLLEELEDDFGSFTDGFADKQTGAIVRIFHGISMTSDDWEYFKEKWLNVE